MNGAGISGGHTSVAVGLRKLSLVERGEKSKVEGKDCRRVGDLPFGSIFNWRPLPRDRKATTKLRGMLIRLTNRHTILTNLDP